MGKIVSKFCDCERKKDSVDFSQIENNSFILQFQKKEDDSNNIQYTHSQLKSSKLDTDHNISSPQKSQISICLNDFKRLKVLGKGSFGKVVLVEKAGTGEYFAMKILKKDQIVVRDQIQNALREKQILQSNLCPFLVKLKYAFQDNHNIYLIMEYVQGGELYFHLKRRKKFNEKTVVFYASQIVLALEYLHEDQNVIYRDLKPENILLDKSGNIKLTDFGLAQKKADGVLSFCGTPEFLAPEMINNEPYGQEIDYWMLGCCIYEMLNGAPPFRSKNTRQLYDKILANKPVYPETLSKAAKDLIKNLLQSNPKKRLNIIGLKQHEFFKDVLWNEMQQQKYQAPINPKIQGDGDTRNFDEHKNINVDPTPPTASNQIYFENFTYRGEILEKIDESEEENACITQNQ